MGVTGLKGQVYELRSMRWKVSKTFWRNGELWVVLTCMSKRKNAPPPWEAPFTFLEVVRDRRVA